MLLPDSLSLLVETFEDRVASIGGASGSHYEDSYLCSKCINVKADDVSPNFSLNKRLCDATNSRQEVSVARELTVEDEAECVEKGGQLET